MPLVKMQWFLVIFSVFISKIIAQGVGSGSNGNSCGSPLLNIGLPQGPPLWSIVCGLHPVASRDFLEIIRPPYGRTSGDASIAVRVCVVEGRGAYKKASKFCPILDEEKSGVECVLGTDRLDCLRRMNKGTVDFGVLAPEDLVAAQWANLDVLVTNELRNRPRPYERSIVAVVNRRILPEKPTPVHVVLRNSTLCHPGFGGEDSRGLSDTLAIYLQSQLTDRNCDENLSLGENRIKSVADFFGRACKPGPWVPDLARDMELKSKYKSLCSACASTHCSKEDPYWGDSGALSCLTEAGDFTWAQLHLVQSYFGITPGTISYAQPENFAYLCRDGSWQPLTGNLDPCVWLNRPWPLVVAKRKAASAVTALAATLTNRSVTVDQHWHGALASLLEVNQAQPDPLMPQKAPLDYLTTAQGFAEAYSQSGCSPPRHITLCTTTPLENHKCDWLSEAGAVYGITPPLQCAYLSSKEKCFSAIGRGDVDVVVADSDWLIKAQRDYPVSPIIHETTPIIELSRNIFAYTKKDANIKKISDLRGKRAAFPRFDGYAWHAVSQYLSESHTSCENNVINYFGDICAPGAEKEKLSQDLVKKLTEICFKDGDEVLEGERHALRALVENKVDVAFVSMKTYKEYAGNYLPELWAKETENLTPVCPEKNEKFCFLSWSNLGHIYAAKNLTTMRSQEIINVFTKLDQLFGKYYPFHTPMFSMYGSFNHEHDVLFNNNTRNLALFNALNSHPFDKYPLNFERAISNFTFDSCKVEFLSSFGPKIVSDITLVVTLVAFILFNVGR